MEIKVDRISKENWLRLSRNVHLSTFGVDVDPELERIDYALLAVGNSKIYGYVTCRETHSDTVYWQYGGSLGDVRASIYILPSYKALLAYCAKTYKRMYTLIENTNKAMLKLAAHCGLVIVGIRNFDGKVLLEHMIEFKGDEA